MIFFRQLPIKLKQGSVSPVVISLLLLIVFLIASVIILSKESGLTILKTRADNPQETFGGDFAPNADIEALCGPGQETRFTKTFLAKTSLDDKVVSVDLKIAPLKKIYAVIFAKVTITFDNKKIRLSKRVGLKYFEKAIFKTPPEEANQTGKIVIIGAIGITQSPITTPTSIASLQFERTAPSVVTTDLVVKGVGTEVIVTPAQTAENTVSSLKITF